MSETCRECGMPVEEESSWEVTGTLIDNSKSRVYPFSLIGDKAAMHPVYLHAACVHDFLRYIADNFTGDLCREQPGFADFAGDRKEAGLQERLHR